MNEKFPMTADGLKMLRNELENLKKMKDQTSLKQFLRLESTEIYLKTLNIMQPEKNRVLLKGELQN